MNLALVLMALAQSNPPLVTVDRNLAPRSNPPLVTAEGNQVEAPAPLWRAPRDGFRFGFGPMGTINVMANNDLAGVSGGVHVDVSYKRGRLEARLAAAVTAFAGWDGHAGFGYLLTASAELSVRFYYWRMLAFGVGAMPGVSTGEAQNCTVDVFPELGGGSYCTPDVKYLYGSIAPVVYPIVAALGGDAQHELGLQLSWPIALDHSYTFPSVMIRYTRMF